MIRLFSALLTATFSFNATLAQQTTEPAPPAMQYISLLEMPAMKNNATLMRYIRPDHQRYYRLPTPLFTQRYASNAQFPSGGYWTGYITTQSFKSGKVGTYYYWDVQGNLRDSRMFFDVTRKNKYSFKLIFPHL